MGLSCEAIICEAPMQRAPNKHIVHCTSRSTIVVRLTKSEFHWFRIALAPNYIQPLKLKQVVAVALSTAIDGCGSRSWVCIQRELLPQLFVKFRISFCSETDAVSCCLAPLLKYLL